jgi:hypothetical protein
MAIAENTNDAEYGYADDFSGTADAESKTIEVDIDHVEVSERARARCFQAILQRGHHTRQRAL